MKHFLIALLIIIFLSSCSKARLEGVYELETNDDFEYSLFDIDDVEKVRCSFIRQIKFAGDLCLIKYDLLNVPMNLSSKYSLQDSTVSFDNPQFSGYGFGFLEVQNDGSLVLGNCVFSKNSISSEFENIDDSVSNNEKLIFPQVPLSSESDIQKSETATQTDQPKPSVNKAVTTKPSPIRGEEKAIEQTKKPEPVKTETAKPVVTPAKEEAKETVQKAPEKPKIDQRAVMGAGGTSGKGTTPASGGAQGTSTEKGDEGDPKGTVDGRAIMGIGSGKGVNSGDGYSLDLAGWDFAQRPNINDRFSTRNGRIVFKITIDEKGRVIQAVPLEYNVSNDVLAYYRQVVNQISFKKQGGAAAEFSTGKITFVIKVD